MHLRQISLYPERFPTKDCYPYELPILQRPTVLELARPITLFVGENGTGKSTLLEAIARACGIHIWEIEGATRLRANPHARRLHDALEVSWTRGRVPGTFFSSHTFKDFSSIVETWARTDPGQLRYFGGRSLLSQSHGQSLMTYFRAIYRVAGLHLLDEPETALSPRSQLALVDLLREMAGAGHAQFIVVSHSPLLLSCPGAEVYGFDGDCVGLTSYEDTDHYRAFAEFFARRRKPGTSVP